MKWTPESLETCTMYVKAIHELRQSEAEAIRLTEKIAGLRSASKQLHDELVGTLGPEAGAAIAHVLNAEKARGNA